MTPQEMINVIQAFKMGKQIEYKLKNTTEANWIKTSNPNWAFNFYDYRIKPEYQKELYQFLIYSSNTDKYMNSSHFYPDLETIKKDYKYHGVVIIKRLDYTKITVEE